MKNTNTGSSEPLNRPHDVPSRRIPVGTWFALALLAPGALLAACSAAVGPEETEEVAQAFTGYPKTYVASVPTQIDMLPVAMAASVGWPGNLEGVRLNADGSLQHMYWAPGQSSWIPMAVFGSNVAAPPALAVFSADGYMQVVAVESGTNGKLRHYWRDNTNQAWTQEALFSQNCVGTPALLNNRVQPTNLEVVVRENRYLKHIWRDSNYVWQNESLFAYNDNVIGDPTMAQTADGRLHVLAERYIVDQRVLGYWIRNNNNVWSYAGTVGHSGVHGGAALVVDDRDNSLFAVVEAIQCALPAMLLELYRFNGTQWIHQNTLGGGCAANPAQDCSTGARRPTATTLNGTEVHTVFYDGEVGGYQHWKVR
jgi:hypothetical protein